MGGLNDILIGGNFYGFWDLFNLYCYISYYINDNLSFHSLGVMWGSELHIYLNVTFCRCRFDVPTRIYCHGQYNDTYIQSTIYRKPMRITSYLTTFLSQNQYIWNEVICQWWWYGAPTKVLNIYRQQQQQFFENIFFRNNSMCKITVLYDIQILICIVYLHIYTFKCKHTWEFWYGKQMSDSIIINIPMSVDR